MSYILYTCELNNSKWQISESSICTITERQYKVDPASTQSISGIGFWDRFKGILEEALGQVWKNLRANIGLGLHLQMARILLVEVDLQYMEEAFRVQLVVLIWQAEITVFIIVWAITEAINFDCKILR